MRLVVTKRVTFTDLYIHRRKAIAEVVLAIDILYL